MQDKPILVYDVEVIQVPIWFEWCEMEQEWAGKYIYVRVRMVKSTQIE